MTVKWEKVKGQKGLEFRDYKLEKSYRFRQYPYPADMLGVMSEAHSINISGNIRANRVSGAGPQSYKDMCSEHASITQAKNIQEKAEREKILKEEEFTKVNTIATFFDDIYWPARSQQGNKHNLQSTYGLFNNHIRPALGAISITALKFYHIEEMIDSMKNKGLSPQTRKHAFNLLQ